MAISINKLVLILGGGEIELIKLPSYGNLNRIFCLFYSLYPPGIMLTKKIYKSVKMAVNKLTNNWNPDILILWGPNYGIFSSVISEGKKIMYACDSMYRVNRSLMRNSNNKIIKIYHYIISLKYYLYESKYYNKFDKIIYISQKDMQASMYKEKSVVVCNGVTIQDSGIEKDYKVKERFRLIYHGDYRTKANYDALKYLVKEIMPALKLNKYYKFNLEIIGKCERKLVQKLLKNCEEDINYAGYVENLAAEMIKADIYVAPISIGSGVKNKILEALYCGIPIVGTQEAFSGIDIKNGVHAIICNRNEMVDNIIKLCNKPDIINKLSKNAKKWARENLDTQEIVKQISILF